MRKIIFLLLAGLVAGCTKRQVIDYRDPQFCYYYTHDVGGGTVDVVQCLPNDTFKHGDTIRTAYQLCDDRTIVRP